MNPCISKEMERFNYLMGEINAIYHDLALKLGLSDSAMDILYTICDNAGPCLLQEICRKSGSSKQTINSALRKLEAEDIVYLESAGAKNKRVCLTAKGKELAERTAMRVIKMENDIFSSWPEEDRKKHLELTERYLRTLCQKAQEL
ncbi:MAG: winged helix-turn-helix transcriptional regulator [Provencibacterium sp.]|jgi:DNA-binding MarR family transcriptional regulator|nr:winged helix-turn-helix transcriptional regulator [Provencibacterium sp.]